MSIISDLLGRTLQPLPQTVRQDARWSAVIDYVDRHLSASLRVRHIAAAFTTPADTLARRFRRDVGCSFKHWLQQRLLDRALHALAMNQQPIKSVAEDLSFSSEFHFSRFIKRNTGQSPTAFRQSLNIR